MSAEMIKEPSKALQQLGKLINSGHSAPELISFAIYKILNEANIPNDDIENIGVMLTSIASGE